MLTNTPLKYIVATGCNAMQVVQFKVHCSTLSLIGMGEEVEVQCICTPTAIGVVRVPPW